MEGRGPAGGCNLTKIRVVSWILDTDKRDLARAFRKLSEALLESGAVEEAKRALSRADEILTGTQTKITGPIGRGGRRDLTPDALERRRRTMSRKLSKKATALHQAAAADDRYGSLSRWARHHGFPVSSIHAAANGTAEPLATWDVQARRDFNQLFASWNWPLPVVAKKRADRKSP